MKNKILIFLVPFLLVSMFLAAQEVVSDIGLMDYQRLAQLKDSTKPPARSYNIRSTSQYLSDIIDTSTTRKRHWPKAQLLQVGYSMQSNTDLPIGSNDGSLYPSVGLQKRITIGGEIHWKGISLILQPEFVTAENKEPSSFQTDPADGNYWARYYLNVVNKIDNFSRFGKDPLEKVFLGQSSLKYSFNNISVGISNENLWWGPGIKNSLVLTNNAPGFLHATINSQRPITTKSGNLEFQVVYGQLKNVETEAPDNETMRTVWADGILKKQNATRALIGYVVSWNPKWTPNLHIGVTGANYYYLDSTGVTSSNLVLESENKKGSASLGSIFFRYAMPKEHAEVYMEYGRSNKLATPFNLIGDTIPTGFTAGFRKLFIKPGNKAGILLGIEITQLQLPDARLIFNKDAIFSIPKTNSWYTHPYVTQGYTHEGQILGASVGPGGNSEMISLSWVKGLKKIGFSAERLVHNNDFYYYNYFNGNIGNGSAVKYWVDWNVSFQFQWNFKQFLLSGFITQTNAINYRWVKLDETTFSSNPSISDRKNIQTYISLSYYFIKSRGFYH